MMMTTKIVTSGKRKRAVARATIFHGTGKVHINKRELSLLPEFRRLLIEEPLRLTGNLAKSYDIDVTIRGGGIESGIEAARLAIARALVKITNSKDLKKVFLEYDRNLLVADTRRKEAYKPGDSKARAKRQKSYR